MMHFKFPYPFFQGYEFTLIKRDKNKKKWGKGGGGGGGVKREIVWGWGSGRVRGYAKCRFVFAFAGGCRTHRICNLDEVVLLSFWQCRT